MHIFEWLLYLQQKKEKIYGRLEQRVTLVRQSNLSDMEPCWVTFEWMNEIVYCYNVKSYIKQNIEMVHIIVDKHMNKQDKQI